MNKKGHEMETGSCRETGSRGRAFRALMESRVLSAFGYFRRMSGGKKKHSALKSVGIAVLVIYVAACFLGMFYLLFSRLCEPFHMMGIDWLYFCMAAMAALVLMFIGSIFMTQAQLFEAKDNELLLAMPVPPSDILLSRMLILYLYNLIFGLLVLLPAGYAYFVGISVTGGMAAAFAVIAVSLPLFSLALASLAAWGIALLSARVRQKSLFTMIFYLLFLAAYFYVYSKANHYIQELIAHGNVLANRIKGAALPLYALGNAIADGNPGQLGIVVLFLVLPFVLVYAVLSKCFMRIATTRRGFAKISYRERSMRVKGADRALLSKELKHFVSSPMYMMNGAIGVIFLVVCAVMLLLKKKEFSLYLAAIPEFGKHPGLILALLLCAMSATNIIAAPSVSLEGKNLWILRSMPVPARSILMAKAKLQLAICLPPALFAVIACAVFTEAPMEEWLLWILLISSANVLFALLGVVINLNFPKLDWVSEMAAVKQSASTIVDMLLAMALVLIPGALYITALKNAVSEFWFLLILTVVYILTAFGLYRYLCGKGCRLFENLQ